MRLSKNRCNEKYCNGVWQVTRAKRVENRSKEGGSETWH